MILFTSDIFAFGGRVWFRRRANLTSSSPSSIITSVSAYRPCTCAGRWSCEYATNHTPSKVFDPTSPLYPPGPPHTTAFLHKLLWLLDVAPVGAESYFGEDGDGELGDVFHLLLDEGLQFVGLGGEDVEEEFVVDLEGHAGAELALR